MNFRFAFALVLYAACTPVNAAEFVVSNINDTGPDSLRQAMMNANATPQPPHRISFSAGFPMDGMVELFSSLPSLQLEVEIDGAGRRPVITTFDQIGSFRLMSTNSSLKLHDLHLQFGRAEGNGGCLAGEGINSTHSLVLDRMTFTRCLAAVYASGDSARGGAFSWLSGGSVTVLNSVFDGNGAASVSAEVAGGGAIAVAGPLRISSSRFSSNIVNGGWLSGGAVSASLFKPGAIEISDSVFLENLANPESAPSAEGLGGAVSIDCGTCAMTLARNHFRGNRSRNGGAVFLRGNDGIGAASVQLHNTSFIDNSASSWGGAVFANGTQLDVRHASFSGNGAATGGHVAGVSSTIAEWSNSVMAPVAPGSDIACSIGAVAAIATGNFVRIGNNGCNVTLPGSNAVPDLMILGIDKSAFMPTLVFDRASPVVDGGDDARCLSHDARGITRPQDGNGDGIPRCDAGAVEHLEASLFADGFEG